MNDPANYDQAELPASLADWRIKCRRRIEAGIPLGHAEWEGWLIFSQNIYLEELERFRTIQRALNASFIASELRGGFVAEDALAMELDEGRQDELLMAQDDRKQAAEQRARVFGRAA